MVQTPMAGDLCLRHLWLEPYVQDPYGSDHYVRNTYDWKPMFETPMSLCM